MQTPFDTLYKKLNPAQKQAVDTIEGPVMVIAGPGTGKTTILTLRIANILKLTDTQASSILAITYTDAGVRAMRSKLQSIIGDRAYDVKIHTFHGFASSIIAEHPDHFLHLSEMKQITDIEQDSLIRSIISHGDFHELRPSGKPDVYISGIMRAIDDAKREAITPNIVRQHAKDQIEKIKNDESSISSRGATKGKLKADAREAIEKCEKTLLFADVYEQYESRKREEKKMDFNDLIIEFLLALKNDELILRLIQEKYLYIHVDEHQDTNDAQNFIIGIIAEFFETPNIFIVGDEKQAIYRFQGASVENFMLLQKKWKDMKVISLDQNYRSHQGILDASFSMIENNYEENSHKDLRIKLVSESSDHVRPIDVITGENTTSMEMHLVEELKNIQKNEPKANIAIITRRNRDLDRIIALLESHDISVSSERSVDIFSHPVGRLFFDLIEYIVDPTKIDSLSKTTIAGLWKLSFEESLEIIRNLRSGKIDETNSLSLKIKEIRNNLTVDGPVSFIIYLAEISDYVSLIKKDPSHVYVWRGIVTLAESLVRDGDIHDPIILLSGLLAYRTVAESRSIKVSVGAPDSQIQALTAHSSKGLEFDYVFIMYTTEESWIGKNRGASFNIPKKQTSNHDIGDTRRLFYVALTRARKHAYIFTALEESDGKLLTPLRFIDELNPKNIAHTLLPRIGVEEKYKNNFSNKQSLKDISIINLAKKILTEKGLSVTALNHFIKCPNTFIYQSILKLPQAPSISAEKGSAMHFAFDAIWKSKQFKAAEIETILHEKIADYFNDSLLSITEKESAKRDLISAVPDVARCLESHFALSVGSNVLTESWVETDFIGKYEDKKISIPLHGKLDAIVDNGSQVNVFDYKTRQAMSVNSIKGETKSSDGNYFRQLVFYKLLVSSDSRWKQRRIVPSLVFVSPDDYGNCPTVTLPIENSDIEKVKEEIQTLINSVWSGDILKNKCDDSKCEWCGFREL